MVSGSVQATPAAFVNDPSDPGRLIESSLGSVATKLNFFIHNLAQMKFTSSEERPTLSFAPRFHSAKSDGIIKNLYICRHIRTGGKGYVSPDVPVGSTREAHGKQKLTSCVCLCVSGFCGEGGA